MLRRFLKGAIVGLGLLLAGPAVMLVAGDTVGADWRAANRDPVGLAPDPSGTPGAMVHVYAARAFGWRGAFGVHSWIAVKPTGAPEWTSYHIFGWRARRGGDSLAVWRGPPDRRWYGAEPTLLAALSGPGTDAVIARIVEAAEAYPYRRVYRVWPGPNSNTFTAWVARAAPELRLDLPPTAVGKDYLGERRFAAPAVSGTGWQVSAWGLVGATAALEEGLEVTLAGLTLGLDPLGLGVKLPGIGRLGPAEDPARAALGAP